jgi:Flp pilus assembly protein TadG
MDKYKEILKKKIANCRGQVVVIFVIIIVVILGMTALVIDLGSLYQKKGFYQTVADAAALAGAQELPEHYELAIDEAVEYADRNNVDIAYDCRNHTAEDILISSTYTQDDTITVNLSNREAPLYFAKIFGMNTVSISAGATAVAGSPVQVYNTVPWAAVIPEEEDWREWLWNQASDEVIKVISGEVEESDFIAWDRTADPAQWVKHYEERIINGYQEPLEVGSDPIFTHDINPAQTRKGVNSRIDSWESYDELVDNYYELLKLSDFDDQFVIVPLIYDTELREWWKHNPEEWPEVEVKVEAFAPFIIEYPQKELGKKLKLRAVLFTRL